MLVLLTILALVVVSASQSDDEYRVCKQFSLWEKDILDRLKYCEDQEGQKIDGIAAQVNRVKDLIAELDTKWNVSRSVSVAPTRFPNRQLKDNFTEIVRLQFHQMSAAVNTTIKQGKEMNDSLSLMRGLLSTSLNLTQTFATSMTDAKSTAALGFDRLKYI